MASSSKLVTLFFLAVAVTLATLPPSEARAAQVLKPDAADQGAQAPPPSPVLPGGSPPAPPQAPVLVPGNDSEPTTPAQPTSCLMPLLPMMPCMDYLTRLTILTPSTACCDGLRSVIEDAPICLCHAITGDMNTIIRDPIDPIKMVILPLACGALPPLQTVLDCATQTVPPLMRGADPVPPPASP